MATTINLNEGVRPALRLRVDGMSGYGRVQPRLIVDFEAQTTQSDQHAEIHAFRLDVSSAGEYLGSGVPHNLVTDVWSWGSQLRVEVPISRAVIDYVDQRREPSIGFMLDVQSFFRIRNEQQALPGQEAPAPGAWREVKVPNAQTPLTIPRTEWVSRVVEPLGVEQFVFLELAIPPTPDRERWQSALAHLAEAEHFYQLGNDPEVLQRCYAAFEALEGAPTRVFEAVDDEPKRKQLNDALRTAKDFMHEGRHVSKSGASEGAYAVDHRDAAFALGQAKVWLTYLSRLLQRS